jgi:hypothetical protein
LTIDGAGTLFLEPPRSEFNLKFGLALFSLLFIGFTNNAGPFGACGDASWWSLIRQHLTSHFWS